MMIKNQKELSISEAARNYPKLIWLLFISKMFKECFWITFWPLKQYLYEHRQWRFRRVSSHPPKDHSKYKKIVITCDMNFAIIDVMTHMLKKFSGILDSVFSAFISVRIRYMVVILNLLHVF